MERLVELYTSVPAYSETFYIVEGSYLEVKSNEYYNNNENRITVYLTDSPVIVKDIKKELYNFKTGSYYTFYERELVKGRIKKGMKMKTFIKE